MSTTHCAVGTCFALAACLVFPSESLAAPGCDTGNNLDVEATGGTPSAGYPTLAAAFSAINLGTHTGGIVIEVCGNTVEPVAGAILNASGSGSSSYATILIKPVGGVARTIGGAATAGLPLIDLNGADGISIDGLNVGGDSLTIVNSTVSSTAGTSTIRFVNGAMNNIVTNASVQGSFSGSGSGGTIDFATDAATANGNDANTISNCDIGPAGANLPAKAIHSLGTTTAVARNNSGIVITNNNIHDYFSATVTSSGVFLEAGTTGWNISNNRLFQAAPRTQTIGTQHSAILINNGSSGRDFVVSGNTIGFATSSGTGTYSFNGVFPTRFYPIYLVLDTTASVFIGSIQGNVIAGIAMSGSFSNGSTPSFIGIYSDQGKVTVGDVTGNTIGSQSAAGSITLTSSSGSISVWGMANRATGDFVVRNSTIGGITATNLGTGASDFTGIKVAGGNFNLANNAIGGTVADSISFSSAVGVTTAGSGSIFANTIRNLTTVSAVNGIVDQTTTSVTIAQNTVSNLRSTLSRVTGISVSAGGSVERNRVYGLTSATASSTDSVVGISVDGASQGLTVQNNMVALGAEIDKAIGGAATNTSDSGLSGIVARGTLNVLHNSVHIGGAATSGSGASYAFNNPQSATVTRLFSNNIFVNARSNAGTATGKNYAVKMGSSAALAIDNNCYLVSGAGGVFGFYNSAEVSGVEHWRIAVGQDLGSFESDPKFLDPTNAVPDLHIDPAVPTIVEGRGFNRGVTGDFDNQTRASLTPVDIGADAGNFTGAPVGPAIVYTPLERGANPISRVLKITVTDPSGVPTVGAGRPVLYFRKSMGAYVPEQCKWINGNDFDCTLTYSLIGGVVPGDRVTYFVVAQNNVGTVSANPTAGAGSFAANPPAASTPPTIPNGFDIVPGLSGDYSVDPGATLSSLTNPGGAFDAINQGVLIGDVTLRITADLASETGVVGLNQWLEEGAGNWKLLIVPSGGVERAISGSAVALIKLNGADRVTIDGLNSNGNRLAITNTSSSSGSAVILVTFANSTGADGNTIRNCAIAGGPNAVTSYGIRATGSTTPNDATVISGNTIIRVQAAISVDRGRALTISNNVIGPAVPGADNIGFAGISLSNLNETPGAAPNITLNVIRNVVSSIAATGISLSDVEGNAIVSGNVITGLVSPSSIGIAVRNYTPGLQLTRNVIASVTGASARGISASSTVTILNPLTIANNFVSNIVGTSSSPTMGMEIDDIDGVKVHHNSVNLFGSHPGATGSTRQYAMFVDDDVDVLDVRNNIFAISYDNSSSTADKSYAIYCEAPASELIAIDNNDYYASGTVGVLGFIGGSDRATISEWQSVTGQDNSSLAADPGFVSSTDLHFASPGLSPVEDAGVPIATVTIDIDGEPRSAVAPDIGADEVDRCAGITCQPSTVCTTHACDPNDGVCKAIHASVTTSCGDPDNNVCNAPDTCDGAGHCIDRKKPANVVCTPGDVSECDADVCDGITNVCAPTPFAPEFLPCGDPDNSACNAPDSCNATGTCIDRKKPANVVCLPGDASGCNQDDVCDGTTNACAPRISPELAPCGSPGGTDCDAPDSCDSAGHCIDRKKPANELCRTSAGDCDVADVCDGISNVCPAGYRSSTAECRASTGTCDPAELCTGYSANCPTDVANANAPIGNLLRVARVGTTAIISWTGWGSGPVNVYRGFRLGFSPWTYNHDCYAAGLTTQGTTDTVTPIEGDTFYYLVSRDDPTCPESSLGPDSDGIDRPNDAACP